MHEPLKNLRALSSLALALTLAAGCSSDEKNTDDCGNGRIDSGEQCDGTDLGGATCAQAGFAIGELACQEDCTIDLSGCTNCGNGEIDATEQCDGTELSDATCADHGFRNGTLSCDDQCQIVTGGCEDPILCGNGVLDLGEQCDGVLLGDATCTGLGYQSGELACSTKYCRYDLSTCSGCSDDSYEGNDVQGDAATITVGSHDLTLCNTAGVEEDWFVLSMTAGERLVVWADTNGGSARADLDLLDASGARVGVDLVRLGGVAQTVEASDNESIYVRVRTFAAQIGVATYQLHVEKNPDCVDHADCTGGDACVDFACESYLCNDDNPCPNQGLCDQGTCVECITVADCPNTDDFECPSGACLLTCADDALEPNSFDAPGSLTVGTPAANLTLCSSSEEDAYVVTLAEGHTYDFVTSFTHGTGDIDLELALAATPADILAAAVSASDDEALAYAVPIGAGGEYVLRVELGPGDFAQTYDLAITDRGLTECIEDDACVGVDEQCLDYTCQVPDCTTDDDCSGQGCTGRTCVPIPTVGNTCGAPVVVASLPHSANDVSIGPFRGEVSVVGDTCVPWGADGKDVVYQVTLAAGDLLVAELISTFDAALYVTQTCTATVAADDCLAGVDATTAGSWELLEWVAPASGTYFVIVDTFAVGYPDTGSFSLLLDTE